MGFFNIFKKNKKKELDAGLSEKSLDDRAKEATSTTTSEDGNATFEIPDFSEEDLDFDIGQEDFMPKEEAKAENSLEDLKEIEKSSSEDESKTEIDSKKENILNQELEDHKDIREYFLYGNKSQEDSEERSEQSTSDFELPAFDEVEVENLPGFETDELPVFDEKSTKNEVIKPVFLSSTPYSTILSTNLEIIGVVKDQQKLMSQSEFTNNKEKKVCLEIHKEYEDIQHNFLYMEQKLFG